MSIYKNVVILGTFLALTSIVNLFASNPADLTSDSRQFSVQFYKVTVEEDNRWACASVPIGLKKDVSLALLIWENDEGTCESRVINLAKRFSENFDASLLSVDMFGDQIPSSLNQYVMLDLRGTYIKLGTVIPLDSREKIKIGPRVEIKNLGFYASLSEDSQPFWGISYNLKGTQFDFAYSTDSEINFFRVSRGFQTRFGTIVPELRTRFTENENFIGVGIGFIH